MIICSFYYLFFYRSSFLLSLVNGVPGGVVDMSVRFAIMITSGA
jgi:hypothetical protein